MPPLVGDTVSQTKQMRSKGSTSRLVLVTDDEDIEGMSAARIAASGVHKQASAMLEVRPLACLIRGRVLAWLLDSTEDA